MKNFLQVLPREVERNSPSKIIRENNKTESFAAGQFFFFEEVSYTDENFHEKMSLLLQDKNSFMVLGELNDFGKLYMEQYKSMVRRKKDKGDGLYFTIEEEHKNNIMVLDLDDHEMENWNPLKPEPVLKTWCKNRDIDVDLTWQITSSQKLDSKLMRVRLYFLLDKEYFLEYRKAFAISEDIQADGSVFSGNQPIYTTPPTFINCEDYIPTRHGFIEGKKRVFKLPKYSKAEIQEITTTQFSDFEYSGNLPDDVLSGRVYRRYFMPLAFSYINKGLDKADIMALIEMKTGKTPRDFDRDNVAAYVDDGIQRKELEIVVADKIDDLIITQNDTLKYTNHDWPSGFLGRFAKEIHEMSHTPKKEISIFAARSITASLMGRRFSFGGVNLNQHNVLLGPQGIGKETPSRMLGKVLDQIKETKPLADDKTKIFEAANKPKGVHAIHRTMARAPSVMIIIPEAGKASKSLSGDVAAVEAYFLTNFAIGAYRPFSVDSQTKELPLVYGTNYVLIEESALSSYRHNFTPASMASGELARKNVHFVSHKMPDETQIRGNFSSETIDDLISLMTYGMSVERYEQRTEEPKWGGYCFNPLKKEDRILLMPDNETEKLITELKKKHIEYVNSIEETDNLQYAQTVRFLEKSMKEACLYAAIDHVLDDPLNENPEVKADRFKEAMDYVHECDRSLLANYKLVDGDINTPIKKIYKFYLDERKGAKFKSKHKKFTQDIITHNYMFGANSKIDHYIDMESQARNVDKILFIDSVYEAGEALGFWEYVHPKIFNLETVCAKLGIKVVKQKFLVMKKIDPEDLEI